MSLPAAAGPPYTTDDPVPADTGHFEIYLYSDATKTADTTAGTVLGMEVDYGLFADAQISVAVPFHYQPVGGDESAFGFGTAAVGVKYRFVHEDPDGIIPDIAFFPSTEIPIRASKDDTNPREFFPIWAQKTFDGWALSGGGGYWYHPGPENRNYWFFGAALTRQIFPKLNLGVEIFHQTADTIDGLDSTGANLGFIFDFTEQLHLVASVGGGLQNAKQTNQYSYYAALKWTP